MKGGRMDRLAEEVRQLLSEILQQRVRDPRLGMVGVTRVELSRDLAHAKVFVSVLGGDEVEEESLKVLERAASFVRHELSGRLHTRRVPELQFRVDPGIRHSVHVQSLLRDLGLGDQETAEGDADRAQGDPAGEPSDDGEGTRVDPADPDEEEV